MHSTFVPPPTAALVLSFPSSLVFNPPGHVSPLALEVRIHIRDHPSRSAPRRHPFNPLLLSLASVRFDCSVLPTSSAHIVPRPLYHVSSGCRCLVSARLQPPNCFWLYAICSRVTSANCTRCTRLFTYLYLFLYRVLSSISGSRYRARLSLHLCSTSETILTVIFDSSPWWSKVSATVPMDWSRR